MTDISKEAIEALVMFHQNLIDLIKGREGVDREKIHMEAITDLRIQAVRIAELKEKMSYVENRNVQLSGENELLGTVGGLKKRQEQIDAQCVTVKPLEWGRADHAPEIKRLRRERDDLAARVAVHNPRGPRKERVFVQGITRLRVRLEQTCHDLMKLELKQ